MLFIRRSAVAFVMLACAIVPAHAQQAIRIGTSTSGSVFYTLAVGMSRMVQDHAGLNATVEPVGGSHANVFAVANDQVDLAIINALAAVDGLGARPPFPRSVAIRLLAQGQPTLRQVLVRPNARITTPSDLAGKTIMGVMPPNPDVKQLTEALLAAAGVDLSSVRLVSMVNTQEGITGLETGTIDALVLPASRGAANVAQLLANGSAEFLDISEELAESLAKALPAGMEVEILSAGSYDGQGKDVRVFSIRTYLVASSGLSEDVVYNTTKSILAHPEEFAQFHPMAEEWTIANTLDNPLIPYHPGAIRFFKETGDWNAELELRQNALVP